MIWLNTQNRVIHCEKLSEGSISRSRLYQRIAAAALRHHAVKCIIAHNHPGGSVQPSAADIRTTQEILNTLNTLSIHLVDHIIISDNEAFSFQADSLMGNSQTHSSEAYAAEYMSIRQFSSVMSELNVRKQ